MKLENDTRCQIAELLNECFMLPNVTFDSKNGADGYFYNDNQDKYFEVDQIYLSIYAFHYSIKIPLTDEQLVAIAKEVKDTDKERNDKLQAVLEIGEDNA